LEQKTVIRVLPAAVLGGSAAGALAAFFLMRREGGRLRLRPNSPRRLAPPEAPRAESVQPEEISPEALSVISAVVAAFFGKTARVRSVRQVRPTPSPWAQQGRVSIQGSHELARG
jgi:hypothetical protein